MTDLATFDFPTTGQTLRSFLADGIAHFVAADIAAALELGNASSSLALLDDDEKGLHTVETLGGPQQMVTVTEAGLYSLILRSRKPEAKAFKRWVTHEVLPAIRQTGRYESAPALPRSYSEALRELAAAVEDREQATAALAIAAPKAEAWEVLASAEGDFSVADAAKILSRDPNIKIGATRLFSVLCKAGWIFRQAADNRWRVYQTAVETGRLSEIPASHYHPRTGELVLDSPQVRVTAKGLEELRRRLTARTDLSADEGARPR